MENNDDIAEEKMSLTEHLVELRKRLTRSLIAVGIGFFACYYFKEWIFDIITRPLTSVLPKNSYLNTQTQILHPAAVRGWCSSSAAPIRVQCAEKTRPA